MSKVVAVANQKGGVGKTTTTVNLASCVAEKGKRVLLVDMDPQGNATSGVGIDHGQVEKSIYDVLLDDLPVQGRLYSRPVKNLYVLPSNIQLAGAEIELVSAMAREHILKHQLELVQPLYDYIFYRLPAFTRSVDAQRADRIGFCTGAHSMRILRAGRSDTADEHGAACQKASESFAGNRGVVLTMLNGRTKLGVQVVEEVKKFFAKKVYTTIIPRNVRLGEAPSFGQPINVYDPRSAGSLAYKSLAEEFLKWNGERR